MEGADTGGVKGDTTPGLAPHTVNILWCCSQSIPVPMPCSKASNTHFMQLNAALVSCNTDLTLEWAVLNGENNQLQRGTLTCGQKA